MSTPFEKFVDITTDLASGDVSIEDQLATRSNSDYNMIPMGVMITKNSASDEVQPLRCKLRGGDNDVTMYLKINEIYPLAVDKVYKNGSSTETIILLGVNN